jgi:hypothetical protein
MDGFGKGGSINYWFLDLEKYSIKKLASVVFAIALIERMFLLVLFFYRNGAYSTHVREIWFYYGVARSTIKLSVLDPTVWILRPLGSIVPEQFLLYTIAFIAILLASITSALVFLLVCQSYDRTIGFVAGITYASMLQPLGLSIAGFTHDLVQFPIILLIMYLGVQIMKKGKKWLAILLIILLLLGAQIGPMILIAFLILPLYIAAENLQRKWGTDAEWNYLGFIILITIVVLIARLTVAQELQEQIYSLAKKYRGLDIAAQLAAGSVDLRPISIDHFWQRFNFLLLFAPFGVITSLKKRDTNAYFFLIFGIIFATMYDRGSRIIDLGLPIVVAHAFTDWRREWSKPMALMLTVVLFITVFNYTGFMQTYSLIFIFIAALILLVLHIQTQATNLEKEHSSGKNINYEAGIRVSPLGLAVVLMIIILFGVIAVKPQPATTKAEYMVYKWLGEHADRGESIYVRWPSGYFVEAVSGVKAVSSPSKIDFEVPKFLWNTEAEAYSEFKKRNIDYIQISEFDFRVTEVDPKTGTYRAIAARGILYYPSDFRLSTLGRTLMFKLLYNEADLKYFRKIHEEKDENTGIMIKLFRIE